MNVIYLHSHDTGRWIQPYGYPVSTPHLDHFARRATIFRKAFAAAPTCSPSRAALLTGMSAHRAGMIGLAHRGFELTHPEQHLAAHLNQAGYHTVLAGEQHETKKDPHLIGYQEILPVPPRSGPPGAWSQKLVDCTVEFLRKPQTRPFFLSVGFFMTHREFPKLEKTKESDYLTPPCPLPDHPDSRHDFLEYQAAAKILDDGVGQILRVLEETGLAKNSLILFTTDHGPAFPGMKSTLYDTGIGISWLMDFPNNPKSGGCVDALVSHLDFFPTVCELTGIPKPDRLEGKSLLPLLRGEVSSIREELFAEVTFHAAYEPMRAIRTERYKYIRRYGNLRTTLGNVDDGLTKSVLMKNGWDQIVHAPEELYDLVLDPGEKQNRILDPSLATIRDSLSKRLHQWMSETQDPLLNDQKVPLPAGARINHPETTSPGENRFVTPSEHLLL